MNPSSYHHEFFLWRGSSYSTVKLKLKITSPPICLFPNNRIYMSYYCPLICKYGYVLSLNNYKGILTGASTKKANTTSADPGGGDRGPDPPPPGKSRVIWVTIGNKHPPPPQWATIAHLGASIMFGDTIIYEAQRQVTLNLKQ